MLEPRKTDPCKAFSIKDVALTYNKAKSPERKSDVKCFTAWGKTHPQRAEKDGKFVFQTRFILQLFKIMNYCMIKFRCPLSILLTDYIMSCTVVY